MPNRDFMRHMRNIRGVLDTLPWDDISSDSPTHSFPIIRSRSRSPSGRVYSDYGSIPSPTSDESGRHTDNLSIMSIMSESARAVIGDNDIYENVGDGDTSMFSFITGSSPDVESIYEERPVSSGTVDDELLSVVSSPTIQEINECRVVSPTSQTIDDELSVASSPTIQEINEERGIASPTSQTIDDELLSVASSPTIQEINEERGFVSPTSQTIDDELLSVASSPSVESIYEKAPENNIPFVSLFSI